MVGDAYAWKKADGPPRQVGVKGAAGLGKTSGIVAKIAKRFHPAPTDPFDFNGTDLRATAIFAPEGKLLAEQALLVEGHHLPAEVIRGRGAKLEKGPAVQEARGSGGRRQGGLPVMPIMCRFGPPNAPTSVCEFYDGCAFLDPFRRLHEPKVWLFAHNYLPLMGSLPKMPPVYGKWAPAVTIIDESFAQALMGASSFPLDRLMAPRPGMKPEAESEIREVAAKVRDLIERGEDPRTVADAETFRRLADLEMSAFGEVGIGPAMKWEVQKERAPALKTSYAFKLATFWRVLAEECGKPRPMQRIELLRGVRVGGGEPRDRVLVHFRREIALPDGPVIAADASLSERIVRKALPRLEVFEIEARRNADVTQVSDTACSRRKLTGYEGGSDQHNATAANRLRDVRHLAEVVAWRARRRHGPGARVLLVTYMEAEKRLREQGEIDGVDIVHFGALRGLDAYKGHAAAIIAGRQQPPLHGRFDKDGQYQPGAEDQAVAWFGDEDEPLGGLPPGERMPRGVPRLPDAGRQPVTARWSRSIPTRACRSSSSRCASRRSRRRSTGCGWSTARRRPRCSS